MTLFIILTVALMISGLVMRALTFIYESPRGRRFQAETEGGEPRRDKPIGNAKFRRLALVNSVVSTGLVYGLTAALYPWIYNENPVAWWRIVVEGAAILALYDFFYYFVHRYPFHEWKSLRRVHSVHHVVKCPSAIDSLYLHPLENIIGLSLLWACTGLIAVTVGPVSIYAFGWAFTFYSLLNIVIHSGLKLPAFPFAPINYLAGRHDKHHMSMKAPNYASVTPLFDILFGTEARRAVPGP